VAIAGDDRETGDAGIAHGIEDFGALGVHAAPVVGGHEAVALALPRAEFGWQVLRIDTRGRAHPVNCPSTFQVAVAPRSVSRNQAFCFAPSIVCGAALAT
jgi:hypothetical protein